MPSGDSTSEILQGRGTGLIPLPTNLYPQYTDTPPRSSDVQFYGMFKGVGSMDNVSIQLAKAIASRTGSLSVYSYNGSPFADPELREYAGIATSPRIALFLGIPDRNHIPTEFFSCPITIGFFVCETDRIHCEWASLCNEFDLIVVPSRFCKTAFVDSGVKTPILVVPHGLEPEYRPYREIKQGKPLVFFNTFSAHSMAERKSVEELIRCFTATFTSPMEARLRLRTQPTERIRRLMEKYDPNDMVELIQADDLSTVEFAQEYSDIHCTVHPSKGEGFGLIPFQSIACERPVIAAPVTGMRDYLSAENSIQLNTRGRVPGVGVGNQCGTYYEVNERHLCECMAHVAENWQREYEKVKAASPSFRTRYAWPVVLEPFLSLVESILNAGSVATAKKQLLERVQGNTLDV